MALRQPRERRDDPPLTQRSLHLRAIEQAVDNETYSGIGADLRRARERAGGDLGNIAGRLRIRVELLAAIEDGRTDDLPDAVYALGFLRTYASYLGFDSEAAVATFKDETQRYAGRSKLVFPLPGPGGRLPGGWLIATSVVLAALAYGGWYYISEQDRIAVELIPDVPERLAELARDETAWGLQEAPAAALIEEELPALAEQTAPTSEAGPQVAAPEIETANIELEALTSNAPAAPLEPLVHPRSGSRSPIAEAQAATATDAPSVQAAIVPEEQPTPAPLEEVASLADPANQPPPVLEAGRDDAGTASSAYVPLTYGVGNTDARVVVHARADSWVQVRGPGGELLLTRVMRPGDRFLAPNRDNLWLMTGNAGALEVVVDGQVLPPLGKEGEVLRDLTLDADRLLTNIAVAP